MRGLSMVQRSRLFVVIMLLGLVFTGCGTMQPVPAEFNPAAYTPIDFGLLLAPRTPGLHDGQLIRCEAYFWEFLTYDPAPAHYYFNQLRYPTRWGELEWFALYRDADMQGYFDLGAMSAELRREFDPKRLDPLIIYGELVPMGGRRLYLQVHHLELREID